ncbi:SusD/RagB family nutrient-binding outer membrane lipoprotein [Paraflavitalea soli]|uniref:SusD/RagB family nutrient-binding outer membrane lipoprotein n=1 Tax=Paraflavitalea soli TaxID=2315862 RepID=A0A3B7MVF4_9BACT|nr:SusD/RagB family nutrient-binding outer membrane lipoprotein [Paraflavitalea soli]AXY77907.1 SusD/RagB family nutrient-binding outer membrane lipoprotein [Paraflavitalea soli]
MTKHIYQWLIAGLSLATISCKKDLAEINKNPNAAENPQPDYLLTATEKITSDLYWGDANNFNSTLLIIQHWAKIQYTEPDRYIFSNSSFTSLWGTGYAQSITNLNTILQLPAEKANANYKGVALILRSWVFSLLTDNYGDIPYKEAGDIRQYLTPKYNTQKEVYFGLLDELKTAGASLTTGTSAPIAGDIIYGGNTARWKKFANALRLRIALRIADRESEKAKQVINEVLNDAGGLISSVDETARFTYTTPPQQNPVAAWFDTRDDYRIGKTLVDKLYALNDPRLPIFANKPTDATVTTYVGVPSGLTNSDANNLGFAKTSKPGSYFSTATAPAVILTYAEVLFGRAEAAARGFTTENAEDLYNQAIKASFNQYAITDLTVINNYTAQATVKFNAANFKKSIGEQKWIALFGQGLEAFAEWRRLDYPQLTAGAAGTLDGKIPVRFIYPGSEQALNATSYENAITNQGPDNLLTKLWFDQY